jgi:hypothetical protein
MLHDIAVKTAAPVGLRGYLQQLVYRMQRCAARDVRAIAKCFARDSRASV